MKKWISILSGLLVLQLALAMGLNLIGEDYGAFEPHEKLLALDEKVIDALQISDGEATLALRKRDGKWLLPESGDFPADQKAVDRLLEKLAGLAKGWPVATTSGAAKRFKVDEGAFERKLTLLSHGEPLTELYVGTSPGFRKVHVRPKGEEAVYAVAFSAWEANTKADDWIDKGVLAMEEAAIERIELPGIILQREGDGLKVADLGEQEESNAQEIENLLGKLAGLRIQSLLGREAKPEFRQNAPELEFQVTRKGGNVLTYRFSKPKDGAYFVLKRSDFDHYFKVADSALTPFKEVQREKLVKAKSKPQTDAAVAKATE